MFNFSDTEHVKCSFGPTYEDSTFPGSSVSNLYFAETSALKGMYSELLHYVSPEEQERADKFHSQNDKDTYIASHAMLRLVLARFLKTNPLEIEFKYGKNEKPCINGNPVHFNLSHSKNAFAIVVSQDIFVGIDLESIDRKVDIYSVVKSFFSENESDFILSAGSEKESRDRFFLIWTRKEALLKAFGAGIIDNLRSIEVSEKDNHIQADIFDRSKIDQFVRPIFLYSKNVNNYYMSLAVPRKTEINYYNVDSENITSYFCL